MDDRRRDLPVGDCIMFATADWDEPYWTNKQHMANELARMGWRILYVESIGLRSPRTGSTKDWKRIAKRFFKGIRSMLSGSTKRSAGVWVLSPLLVPGGHEHPLWGRLNRWLLEAGLRRSLSRLCFRDFWVWAYHPYLPDMTMAGGHTVIYHCVDDLSSVPGLDGPAFRRAEDKFLRRADVVFVTSPALADRCTAINPNTHFFPNVVDAEHFGKAMSPGQLPCDLEVIPEPRLCYHGVLSDFKIDFQLLLDAAVMRPEWHWVFIGEEREGQRCDFVEQLRKLPNVYFLGYRPYESLPDYLRGVQVGLLPSKLNEYTRSMFPMKYFEYLAAGVPVVSTPLDAVKSQGMGVEFGATAKEFVVAIERQLGRGRLTAQDAEVMVQDNTWRSRTEKMLRVLSVR